MDDVNRPLRRLEVARRIQELREKAATHGEPGAGPGTAAEPPERAPSPSAASQRVVAPRAAADDVTDDVTDEVTDDVRQDVVGGRENAADEGEAGSAAATIASLLRGGQTWILDHGDRP